MPFTKKEKKKKGFTVNKLSKGPKNDRCHYSEWNAKERLLTQCLYNQCCKEEGNDGYRCHS